MAKTKFDIKTEATKPLYAYVGVTDLAVEIVRDLVSDAQTRIAGVQRDVTARVADVQKTDPKVLREQAVTVVNARVDALTKAAEARRKAIETRVADLQAEAKAYPVKVQHAVDENVANLAEQATDTYADLVKRGESLLGRIRGQQATQDTAASARTTVTKAKTTLTQTKKAAAAESTATKKTSTARKTAAKKSTVKTTTAKKTSPAKTTAAKSTLTKPAATKVATKSTATKPAAAKAPVRKAATKQTTVAQSSAKVTVTAAQNTASNAVKAVSDAAEKVGD